MKRLILSPVILLLLIMTGCDTESPMDVDLYPQQVYIVGARNTIVDRDLNIGNETDTISVSVAVGGSRPLSQDVIVQVAEEPGAIESYNTRELSAEVTQYQKLADGIYSYPSDQVTVHAGKVYNTFPILVKPASLHVDSLYMLPLKLTTTNAFELNKEDTLALVRINMVNEYSGLYYMDAVIRNTTNPNDTLVYQMVRNLKATDDGNTVRLYHYNNEYSEGDNIDYRPSHAFKITVNADNSLSFAPWDQFSIIDGGGEYLPNLKLYEFWYTFQDNGVVRRTEGYLYKERKTTEEQRIIDDWLEDQRKGS